MTDARRSPHARLHTSPTGRSTRTSSTGAPPAWPTVPQPGPGDARAAAYLYFADGGDAGCTLTWRRARRARREIARRARGPGRRARGPRRHRLDHPGRVGPRRPRRHLRRRRDDDHLPDDMPEDVAYILTDSGTGRLRRERGAGRQAARPARGVPGVLQVITLTGPAATTGGSSPRRAAERGREGSAATPASSTRASTRSPPTLAASSTRPAPPAGPRACGYPRRLVYEGAVIDAHRLLNKDDLQFLWLPLSHVFGKMLVALPLQIGFPTAVDGRVDKIVDNIAVIKPTFMGAAPRIFEKAHGRIALMLADERASRRSSSTGRSGGRRVRDVRPQGEQPSGRSPLAALATSSCCTRCGSASADGSVS